MNAKSLSEIPGVSFNFSQNIEDNVEEAVTGVKGELAVKIFGDDLTTLESKGRRGPETALDNYRCRST